MPDSTATAAPHYGFYDRLKAEFPSQIIVDVTEVCNLACVHCPHPTFKKSSFYAARYQSPDLNAKLIEEVRTHGRGYTQHIRYTGEGEPLIHPHIFEMLRSAKQHSGVLVSLTTNGTLLQRETHRGPDRNRHRHCRHQPRRPQPGNICPRARQRRPHADPDERAQPAEVRAGQHLPPQGRCQLCRAAAEPS